MIPADRVTRLASASEVATHAAQLIAMAARDAVQQRGEFLLALSGGTTATAMFDALAVLDLPWNRVHIFQVDERVAPVGSAARNLTALDAHLVRRIDLPPGHRHPMPVDSEPLGEAAAAYAATLRRIAGAPPVFDLIHLGLGSDGHTASLVDGDALLTGTADVVSTLPYRGHRRMTLTRPVLDSARALLWVITGESKRDALERLLAGDRSIPAGRVEAARATVATDLQRSARPNSSPEP